MDFHLYELISIIVIIIIIIMIFKVPFLHFKLDIFTNRIQRIDNSIKFN